MRCSSTTAIVLSLLAMHAALLGWRGWCDSPGIDEVAHLSAGLAIWETGQFDLYAVNPPLVRLLAAAPVAAMRPVTDWSRYFTGPGVREEFEVGNDFIVANPDRWPMFFAVARWALIPLVCLGACTCWRFARELGGQA